MLRSSCRTCAARHPWTQVCDKYGCLLIMDASLLSDNLHFNKTREQVGGELRRGLASK